MESIDITSWPEDPEFSAAYPEGARPKRVVLSPSNPEQAYIKPQWRHMFKRSSNRSDEQFWSEVVAYEVGQLLEIEVPPCYPAYDCNSDHCGALSPWFYDESKESYFAAGNFYHRIIDGFDRDKGTQHNLLDAHSFNERVLGDSQIYDFWGMLLFDAIIGNTDRHQDNWGHILESREYSKSVAKRRGQKHYAVWRFAPWFDNGTSLGYEIPPRKFTQWRDQNLDTYIMRGRHHLRFAPDNLVQIGHIESLRFIKTHNALVSALLLKKLKGFNFEKFLASLARMVAVDMPEGGKLSQQRADFIARLTKRRLEIALETLK